MNQEKLGGNRGGFLPFKFKINKKLKKAENYLAVRVENFRKSDRIPCEGFDWYNYGGIYRDIYIDKKKNSRFKSIKIKTLKIIKNKAIIELNYEQTQVFNFNWEVLLKNQPIINGNEQPENKKGSIIVSITHLSLWGVKNPILYSLNVTNETTGESEEIKFGIRKIEIFEGRLYLNKKFIPIRGVSLHKELVPYGRTIPREERRKDLITMKRLGFNALRSSHNFHDESIMELADELGVLILEEIPIYWMIEFSNPKVLKLGLKMIKTLTDRDYNHPSVIMWSLANEIPVENKHCQRVMKVLYEYANRLDDSRIVTHVTARLFGDPLRKYSDVACLNMYFGWYLLSEKNINLILELIRPNAPNKPFFITEFGAGAKFGFHSEELAKFTEEKQASILSHSIKIFNSKNWIQGHFIWIYRDFKSPLRTNKYQKGFNRKGIVSEKNELKLIAKAYNNIKDKTLKTRKFRLFSVFGSLVMSWLEKFLMDTIIGRVMKIVSTFQSEKYYKIKKEKIQ